MITKPQSLIIAPGQVLTISKANAREFHNQMKEMIMDSGYGMFEYLEVIKFFESVKECITGNKQTKTPEDSEFIDMVRGELSKYEKGKHTSARGVRFELSENGTSYDFSGCNDEELNKREHELQAATEAVKERKEFLKNVPKEGLIITDSESGETYTIYPPVKNSKSGYKISLAK
jgi:glucosamine 6-phosphate synthetase-like amidotransferase/phosphosugar isomerase protein